MNYQDLTTAQLVETFNARFDKAVKVGSYTRTKMVDQLIAADLQTLRENLAPMVDDLAAQKEIEETPVEETPVEETPVEETPTEETPTDPHACPLCGGDPSNQTPAGVEGTFMGDSCNFCHNCSKAYNTFTGEEVPYNEPGASKKRRIINPQAKIDAKVAACAAVQIDLFYDREIRLWTFIPEYKDAVLHMPSRDFAAYTVAEMVDYAKAHFAD